MGSILLHREEIEKCLDISFLTPYLCKSGLIDVHSKVADDGIERRKRIEYLMKMIVEEGDLAYGRFVEALKDSSDEHMGHQYLASLLEGRPYGTEEEVVASNSVKLGINNNMPEVVRSLNGQEMLAYLMQDRLLTPNEYEELSSFGMTTNTRNLRIIRIIGTKGPTAHYLFAECIKHSSTTVSEHEKLHKRISSELPTKCSEKHGSFTNGITRPPRNIEPEGMLVSNEYFTIIKKLRRLYLEGKCDEAEKIVDGTKLRKNTELNIALLLESCTTYINKKMEDEVITRVTMAKEMCCRVTNNNRIILEGRCMWTLGKMYRYLKNDAKADEYISHARSKLFNVAPGEDTALINYCYAATLLDKISPEGKCQVSDSIFEEAEKTLRITIHDAELGDYGLDLCHPKIRLAQLHLGSSSHRAGMARNADCIACAWDLLSELDTCRASMAVRTECMYYYTMSDFHRNKGDPTKALLFGQKALDIATKNGFETEKSSIEKRLAAMAIQ